MTESSLPTQSTTSWVDRLRMVPITDSSSTEKLIIDGKNSSTTAADRQQPLEFNIVSLNMLAETYVTPRSHPGLPESYANVAFDSTKRRKLLVDTLERFCSPSTRNPNNITDGDSGGVGSGNDEQKWDVIALQELDLVQPDDPILPAFQRWGYQVVRTPNDQRKDCCAIAFDKSKFTLLNHEVVRFDDLAALQQANTTPNNNISSKDGKDPYKKNSTPSPPELTGLVRSFLRRNYAIVAHLQSVETTQSVIVASVHLYWNPGFEYVKLCQAKYLLDRVADFASTNHEDPKAMLLPTVICGDMNSKPGSVAHSLFVKPFVDARAVAPWNYFWDRDDEIMYTEEENVAKVGNEERVKQDLVVAANSTVNGVTADFAMYCGIAVDDNDSSHTPQKVHLDGNDDVDGTYDDLRSSLLLWNGLHKHNVEISSTTQTTKNAVNIDDDGLKASLAWSKLHQRNTPQDYQHLLPPVKTKYMLDYTLNRFTRWLRILGIDARLETLEEEKERTTGGNIALFDHCKLEQRTLLTTSYKLLLRKDCPPGAYLLDPKSTSDLEKALPRLLRTHGVQLSPRKFLTVCVVCNGDIQRVFTNDEKRLIFMEHGAPDLVDSKEDLEVFRCNGCRQGYWWDDRPSSSASRVFSQATKLLRICLRGGVGLKDEAVNDEMMRRYMMGAFDFVDVEKERHSEEYLSNCFNDLSVISWLRDEKLSSAFNLKSAYALADTTRESLPFTNVTNEFVGCLDYVFYNRSDFDLKCTLHVPTSFRDMNTNRIHHGHLIPSDIWPSDHIAVGARLKIKQCNTANMTGEFLHLTSPFSNEGNRTDMEKHKFHAPRCGCGCVPNILSLFEMAELRKKAKEMKAAEAALLRTN